MSNEPNKPIEAEELTEKELEGVVGGLTKPKMEMAEIQTGFTHTVKSGALKVAYMGIHASVECAGW